MRTSRLLVYMQETANLQCEDYGLPLDTLRDECKLGFVLAELRMRVLSPILAYEEITVNTWCRESKGYAFYRYFQVLRGGVTVALATTVWGLVDINTKHIIKGSILSTDSFPYDAPLPVHVVPRKAIIDKDTVLTPVGERVVRYSDIDYNMHMNNTNYPDMLCDFLPDMQDRFVSSISLSYLKEAHYKDKLSISLATSDDGFYALETKNQNGDACLEALIQLSQI